MENTNNRLLLRFDFLIHPTFLLLTVVMLLHNSLVAAILSMEILYIISFLDKSPFHLTLFMMLGAVLSIVASPFIGRLMDRSTLWRKYILIIACVSGVAGCYILYITKDFWVALSVEMILFTIARNINPALIAQSYATSDLAGKNNKEHWVSVHRAMTSFGWIIGPPIAGFVVDWAGYQNFFFYILFGYLILLAFFVLVNVEKHDEVKPKFEIKKSVGMGFWGIFSVFILIFLSMFIIDTNLPLLTNELGGMAKQVGILFGIAGIGEVVLITFGGYFVQKFSENKIIITIVILGVIFCILSGFATSINQLYVAQLVYGIYLGIMLGTSYLLLQKLRPNEPGLVATYYYNAFKICKMFGAGLAAMLNGFYSASTVVLLTIIPIIMSLLIFVFIKKRKVLNNITD